MTITDDMVERLAATVLKAAGSRLRHYTPESRKAILSSARAALEQMGRENDRLRSLNAELSGIAVSVGIWAPGLGAGSREGANKAAAMKRWAMSDSPNVLVLAAIAAGAWYFWPQLSALIPPQAGSVPDMETQQQQLAPRPGSANVDDVNSPSFWRALSGNLQTGYQKLLSETGRTFRPVRVILFEGVTSSPCAEGGRADSRRGPVFCELDRSIAFPPSFLSLVRSSCGRTDCSAVIASVLAHELGHAVEEDLGMLARVRDQMSIELTADCFSGAVLKHLDERLKRERNGQGLLEPGELESITAAIASIGDDIMMRRAGMPVDPSRFTHGSSAQRRQFFLRGFQSGRLAACTGGGGRYASGL